MNNASDTNDLLTFLDQAGSASPSLLQAILALVLAFVLGQAGAWMYVLTHQGLSYSRSFVQSIILLTVLLCIGMMVIGNNIVVAFGLIGALSVIRFRNILKDTRDTAFIFFALITGMATGTGNHGLAILGTVAFGATLLYLHFTNFGNRDTGDGFLRFDVETGDDSAVRTILERECRSVLLVSQRFHQDAGCESSYRLSLKDASQAAALVGAVKAVEHVRNVSFVLQEDQAEL